MKLLTTAGLPHKSNEKDLPAFYSSVSCVLCPKAFALNPQQHGDKDASICWCPSESLPTVQARGSVMNN
eukprot:889626-Amphidinium_carterae.1